MENLNENNRLIAEFNSGEIMPESWTWDYHTSWESLMSVVDKIETIERTVISIAYKSCVITCENYAYLNKNLQERKIRFEY